MIPLLHTTREILELSNLGRKDTIHLQYHDFELTLINGASGDQTFACQCCAFQTKKEITLLYSSYEIGFVEEKRGPYYNSYVRLWGLYCST